MSFVATVSTLELMLDWTRIMATSMVCEKKIYVRNQFEVGQFQDFAMPYVSEVADGH